MTRTMTTRRRLARILTGKMSETNGGGCPEEVPGFDVLRALTTGFESSDIGGPALLTARPDGGMFSRAGQADAERLPTAKPENVIGHDSRVQVVDTAMTPWRCICHLEVEFDQGPIGLGTGFIAGPHCVLTAAHVLVDRTSDGLMEPRFAKRVRITPGRNGPLAPYGFVIVDNAEADIHYLGRWGRGAPLRHLTEDDRATDVAAIYVDKMVGTESFFERIGYFGLKSVGEKKTDGKDEVDMLLANNAGYPQSFGKPYGTLWYNAGRLRPAGDNFIEYRIDTEGGQSGSPIYYYDRNADQRFVIGIHTTGYFVNRGVRLSSAIFDRVADWAEWSPETYTPAHKETVQS
ncbi:hypothetical protein HKCCE2091_09185 [Rhodobacterales bacterium HKCCE2091]|nr:hypothetical protein [Rhodobacterales bacterium HKCCE2091]